MAPLFLEFAADRGEVATDAPELRGADGASLHPFLEGAIDGRELAGDPLHLRMGSLRATLDWSYDLLSDPEKMLFRRLSIFAGRFTLNAAEAVCGDDAAETRCRARPARSTG